jgi:hypothetical protein
MLLADPVKKSERSGFFSSSFARNARSRGLSGHYFSPCEANADADIGLV